MEKGTAYFVKYPRTLQDLLILHDVAEENPYEIVKDIRLQPIDYENFIACLFMGAPQRKAFWYCPTRMRTLMSVGRHISRKNQPQPFLIQMHRPKKSVYQK